MHIRGQRILRGYHSYILGLETWIIVQNVEISEAKNDVMGQFHNALYLGDIRERVKILENAGHLSLAYITAVIHGLHDIAERLAAELGDNVPVVPKVKSPSLLLPPTPIICGGDWPLLRIMRGIFEGGLDNVGKNVEEDYEEAADDKKELPW
ncbi:hypothetical protein PS1_004545 [Malus domestica]